ncbi:hypothetical protein DSO57_1039638 [Entomophthora muscae]|uniref:Uncharacterized protein n=1 Tax=Entomophthora muscae TaxID=34485 RepID=A0ACC2SES9_9FUNG|nr:hypothetical protein DSO57_1039638 [Entomophthora muscae]
MAISDMETKLLTDLTNQMGKWKHKLLNLETKIQALNVFIYSKLWYIAHLMPFTQSLEKKIDTLTRSFLWGKATAAPIKLSYIQYPKQSGGMGLLPMADKARQIWSKSFLAAIEAKTTSPALGRAYNWIESMKPTLPITTLSLRLWMLTHPGLHAMKNSAVYWQELWRALRRSQWAVRKAPPDEIREASILKLEQQLENTVDIKQRQDLLYDITILTFPTYWKSRLASSKNFNIIRKTQPDCGRPKLIRDWTYEGRDVSIPLKNLIELMNSLLVSSTQQATTWRIMNRAY